MEEREGNANEDDNNYDNEKFLSRGQTEKFVEKDAA
jgi:hypothetical protein